MKFGDLGLQLKWAIPQRAQGPGFPNNQNWIVNAFSTGTNNNDSIKQVLLTWNFVFSPIFRCVRSKVPIVCRS